MYVLPRTPLEVLEHPDIFLKRPADLIEGHHGVNGVVVNVGKSVVFLNASTNYAKVRGTCPRLLAFNH
jgi:hypothetical protein